MKHKILFIALIAIFFASCSKSDTSEKGGTSNEERFLGQWTGIVEAVPKENGTTLPEMGGCGKKGGMDVNVEFRKVEGKYLAIMKNNCTEMFGDNTDAILFTTKDNHIIDETIKKVLFIFSFEKDNKLIIELKDYLLWIDNDKVEAEIEKLEGNVSIEKIKEIQQKYTIWYKYKWTLNRK